MKLNNIKWSSVVLIAVLIAMLTAVAVFAWIGVSDNTVSLSVAGSLVEEYFHCGSGTAEDPFVITRPIHYYHLVEFFQRLTNLPVVFYSSENTDGTAGRVKFGEEYLYFQIGCSEARLYDPKLPHSSDVGAECYVFSYNNEGSLQKEIRNVDGQNVEYGTKSKTLNMAYYADDLALMPIGSSEIPFNGQLDGNNLTVANLNVVTSTTVQIKGENTSDETSSTTQTVTRKTTDIGVFGYVGAGGVPTNSTDETSIPCCIKDLYFENLTIDLSGLEASDEGPVVTSQEHLINAEIHENGDICYAGYIAGHIRDSTTVTDVYINNSTIIGGNAAKIGYGYFGCVEDSSGHEATTLGTEIAEVRGSGDNAGFGGSIDMASLYTRIRNVLGSGSYGGVSRKTNYPTRETVTAPSSDTGSAVVTENATAALGTDSGNHTLYRWTSTDAGTYIGSVSSDYNYLYGLTSARTTEVTTLTQTGEMVPAWQISNNGYYLSLDGTAIAAVRRATQAKKWISDGAGHWYAWIDNVQYYLNRSGTSGVVVEHVASSAATVWTQTSDNKLYTTVSGTNYYLYYNGSWTLTKYTHSYKIYTNGSSHYLCATTTRVSDSTNIATSTDWQISNPTGNTTFFIDNNGTNYYLGFNGTELTVGTSSVTWSYDSNGHYCTYGGEKFYLCYSNGAWTAMPLNYFRVTDGNGHWLSAVSTTALGNASQANSSVWFMNESGNSTSFATIMNGTKYYLAYNNGLTLSNTATSWNKDTVGYYITSGAVNYYLTYENGWTAVPSSYYTVKSGDMYLTADNMSIVGSTTSSTKWYFSSTGGTNPSGNLYTMIGGDKYYLSFNGSLLLSTSASTSWQNNGSSVYCTLNSVDFYLEYNNGWFVRPLSYITINDGGSNYLRVTGANTFANGNSGNATHFYADGSKYYCIVNGAKLYLYNDNGTLHTTTATATATAWENDGSSVYTTGAGGDTIYALQFSSGTWSIKTIVIGNYITDGTNYLTVSGTTIGNTTDVNTATKFVFQNNGTNPSGTIKVSGTNYYLRNDDGDLQVSATSTNWSNNGNNLYSTYETGGWWSTTETSYLVFDGSWHLSDSTAMPYGYKVSYSGNYLNLNNAHNGLTSTTNASDATVWFGSPLSNSGNGKVYTTVDGVNYYLQNSSGNGSALRITTSESSGTTWYYKSGALRAGNYSGRYVRWNNAWQGGNNSMGLSFTGVTVFSGRSRVQAVDTSRPTVRTAGGTDSAPRIMVTKENNSIAAVSVQSFTTHISLSYERVETSLALTFTETEEQLYASKVTTERRSGYIPLRVAVSTDEEYDANKPYAASNKNTGYIVGGTYSAASGSGQGDIRVSGYSLSNISSSYNRTSQTYSKIYTFNGSGSSPVEITDSYKNRFTQYDIVCANFLDILKQDTSYVYGMHFMNTSISMSHLIQAESVRLFGKTYVNYDLPESAIDFNVVERGYITFMAGDWYSNNNAFFSLNQIFRNKENKITDIKQISAIYQHETLKSGRKYIYKYSDNTYTNSDGTYTGATTLASDYELVFDCAWIMNPTNGNAFDHSYIYYFEIPCNVGEYALGSVNGRTGAYLLYLDIATNGGDIIKTVVSSEGNAVTDAFKVEYRSSPSGLGADEYSVLQWSVFAPDGTDRNSFSVTVSFDGSPEDEAYAYGLYTITVVNKSGENIDLSVMLCDDDRDSTNDFLFAYRIMYINNTYSTAISITEDAENDYFKSMGIFMIPSTGDAEEVSYIS